MAEKKKRDSAPDCAACPFDWSERACRRPGGKGPAGCPTLRQRKLAKQAQALTCGEDLEFARQASRQEASGYAGREGGYARVRPLKPRIQELMEFASRMGYRRLGLAFCIGLRKEAAVVRDILAAHGFTVVSASCKVGRAEKSLLGLGPEDQVDPGASAETMCNPVFQAMLLNEHGAELNVLLGLCVGHDSLFIKHATAPVTVLAVKDRLLGHNPLAAIYHCDSYWRSLKTPPGEGS
jgi:uncharacterized metal-binding protein